MPRGRQAKLLWTVGRDTVQIKQIVRFGKKTNRTIVPTLYHVLRHTGMSHSRSAGHFFLRLSYGNLIMELLNRAPSPFVLTVAEKSFWGILRGEGGFFCEKFLAATSEVQPVKETDDRAS